MEWGRESTQGPSCDVPGCPEPASYWVEYNPVGRKSGRVTQHRVFCGPHFRQWMDQNYQIEQLTLFGPSAAQVAGT